MSKLRRYYQAGQYYFITCVTHDRIPILVESAGILRRAWDIASHRTRCELHAWVILPDHLHLVVEPIDGDASRFVKSFKQSFLMNYRKSSGIAGQVWQHRFWDHIIRDEQDYRHHLDYIHSNPVKHGIVSAPSEYPLSSFAEFVEMGWYESDWLSVDVSNDRDYGE